MNSFYTSEELSNMGFLHIGENVLISRKASLYGVSHMSIGNNVRIDDFCLLSGKITLGNYIHISAYSALFAGDYGITFEDFTTFSSRGVIYAQTDDYSGAAMTNPMVPEEYTHVTGAPVTLKKHVIVGTGCTILPGVTLEEGASVGAMTLINKSLDSWGIYCGIPARFIKPREKNILKLEEAFMASLNNK